MSAKYKPGLIYCEMVKMDALIRNDVGTFHILDFETSMHPIGAQLCGSKPAIAGKAAKILEDLGFDVIDFNCGCPVDKVTKDGSGSGMLKNPELIGDILSEMVAAVKVPVTVKIRAGWDELNIIAPKITKIAEQAGAKAICIHGRTRQQAYKGPANWDWIKMSKEAAKEILVIGNGDLFTADDALKMFKYTDCDAVLVARGTLGQPWIVQDIRELLEGKAAIERSFEFYKQALIEHFEYIQSYHPTRKAIVDMRRVGCWYFKKNAGTRAFREKISHVASLQEVRNILENFQLDELAKMEDDEECGECNG